MEITLENIFNLTKQNTTSIENVYKITQENKENINNVYKITQENKRGIESNKKAILENKKAIQENKVAINGNKELIIKNALTLAKHGKRLDSIDEKLKLIPKLYDIVDKAMGKMINNDQEHAFMLERIRKLET